MNHIILNSQDKEKCILFQLSQLSRGQIIYRPSKTCKSPYVADVLIHDTGETTLVHSPSLGCSGLCETTRYVLLQPSSNEKGKCTHRIMLAEVPLYKNIENTENIYVSTHPRLAEDVVKYALSLDLIDHLKGHRTECVKEQITFGTSRFDFAGIGANGRPFLLEVKCVPLAEFEDIDARERNKKNYNDINVWDPLKKVAYFPDGYRKKKTDVISPRALKHVKELEAISIRGDIDTYLCFVIQRRDVSRFVVSDIDPIYQKAVKRAMTNGVNILTLQCAYDEHGVCRLINQNILDERCFEKGGSHNE